MNIGKIVKNNKYQQVSVLYISSLLGILLGVLTSVINTRNLVPELYGNYRYVQNIISFVSSILLVGFFTSGSRLLALSKDEAYSRRIRGAMCTILGITNIILMIVMAVLYVLSIGKGNSDLTSVYLVSIPLCGNMLFINYINTTAQGDNQINRIALARFLPSLLYCIAAFLIYRYIGASSSLMLALFNGSAIIVLGSIIISTKPSFKNVKESFRILNEENKKYGFNVYLGSLMGVSTQYIAGIALGQISATNAEVGFYNKVLKGSIAATILSFILFSFSIKYIVGFLYDESYSSVSVYSIYLAAAACVNGLGDLFNRFLGAHGQGRQIRNGAFACGVVVLLGCFTLIPIWGIYGAIATRVLSATTYFICMVLFYLVYIKKNGETGK